MNVNKCRDHKSKEECFAWAKDGKCHTDQGTMRAICASTCKFCK